MRIRYAKINGNDSTNCVSGVNVSVWTQGCPHKCKGCFNPETWSETGGLEDDIDTIIDKVIKLANANGVKRGLSVLGGEPLSEKNFYFTFKLIKRFKEVYPDRLVYIWTGYTVNELGEKAQAEGGRVQQYLLLGIHSNIQDRPYALFGELLDYIDYIIDGPFEEKQKDLSLKLRGSANQHIYQFDKKNKVFILKDDDV
jgi:anaerobic ribonucleoside-triphosphate reductase activating protein